VTRVIGLDHGTRRIGVAVGDLETGVAFERPALIRHALDRDLETLAGIAHEESATTFVVGLPRNMNGSEGAQAQSVRRFADRLREIGLDVVFVDERLSSWAAGQELAAAGRSPHRSRGELDSAAARLVLQEYLDARRPPMPHPEETV
jgi:putative Holliday junction resolvase